MGFGGTASRSRCEGAACAALPVERAGVGRIGCTSPIPAARDTSCVKAARELVLIMRRIVPERRESPVNTRRVKGVMGPMCMPQPRLRGR